MWFCVVVVLYFLCENHVTTEAFIFASVQKEVLTLSSFISERYNTHSKNQFSRTSKKKILNLCIDFLAHYISQLYPVLRIE